MGQTRCINCMELIEDGSASCPHCGYRQEGELSPFGIKPNTILKGRYLVGRILGQGGFGITYVGYDLTLDVKVAIKEYFPMGCATRNYTISNQIQWNTTQFSREQWQQGSENFLKEARRMAKLDSLPGIVRVKDTFPENQTSYIVMEYIEGETLKQKLQKTGTMQIRDCIKLLTPLMESLGKMHQKGLIHRDISPDNIMIKPDGSACLLDFGAAKDVSFQQSIASQQVVKKGFSPPEQYGEKGKIGSWTDVYALCATIYYCVTGKLVPDAMDRMYEDTLDFSAPVKECMGETAADALRDGLKFRGEERIQTVEELLGRLSYGKDDIPKPDVSKPDISQPDVPKPDVSVKKKNRKTVLIAAVVGCFILFLIGKAVFSGGGEAEDDTALFAYTLMEDAAEDAVNDIFYGSVLGSNINRESIVSVTFLDTVKNAPETAWDASWNQDGTVMAWTERNADKEQYYDLFIGAEGGVKAKDCFRLFAGYHNVETIAFHGCFDTSEVKNMESMFYDCKKLKALDAESLNTGKAMKMRWMFYNCESLTKLDVSGFDTSAAENMKSMFCGCKNLEELNVSGFDTKKVTDMSYMFNDCEKLTALDVGNFDTSQVTTMKAMFQSCFNLTQLDVSNFDTSKVTDMSWMFNQCKGLTGVDVSSFQTDAVTDMTRMFQYCGSLKDLDLSGFNIGDTTDMTDMFNGCSLTQKEARLSLNKNVLMKENAPQKTEDASLSEKYNIEGDTVYLGTVLGSDISRDSIASVTFTDTIGEMSDVAWDVSMDRDGTVMAWVKKNTEHEELYDLFIGAEGGVKGQEDCSWLFAGYYNVETIRLNRCFNTSRVTDMSMMFYHCAKLKSLDADQLHTGAVTNMGWMFCHCRSLVSMDTSGFDTSQVTDMSSMFNKCENLTTLDVSGFDTSRVTNMRYMFYNCSGLTTLDVSSFNTSQVTNMQYMFRNCSGLTTLDVSGFNTGKVTEMDRMFALCSNLTTLDVSKFDTSAVTNMASMFNVCESLTTIDVSGFDTSQVTDMRYMFCKCPKLTTLDVSGFNTSQVTDMQYMFCNCPKLTALDVSSFDTSQVTDMQYMFYNCSSLTALDVSNFTVGKETNTEEIFTKCGVTAKQAGFRQN